MWWVDASTIKLRLRGTWEKITNHSQPNISQFVVIFSLSQYLSRFISLVRTSTTSLQLDRDTTSRNPNSHTWRRPNSPLSNSARKETPRQNCMRSLKFISHLNHKEPLMHSSCSHQATNFHPLWDASILSSWQQPQQKVNVASSNSANREELARFDEENRVKYYTFVSILYFIGFSKTVFLKAFFQI